MTAKQARKNTEKYRGFQETVKRIDRKIKENSLNGCVCTNYSIDNSRLGEKIIAHYEQKGFKVDSSTIVGGDILQIIISW